MEEEPAAQQRTGHGDEHGTADEGRAGIAGGGSGAIDGVPAIKTSEGGRAASMQGGGQGAL